MRASSGAVCERSRAPSASCWAVAEVSCVEALTCCAEADECSARLLTSVISARRPLRSPAIWSAADAIVATRVETASTASASWRRASWVSPTVSMPSAVRSPLASDRRAARRGRRRDGEDQPADLLCGAAGLLGEAAHLLGDYRE